MEFNLADLWEAVVDAVPEREAVVCAHRRFSYAETDGRYFRLRPKILELGFSALSSMTFSELAQPVMDELADSLDEIWPEKKPFGSHYWVNLDQLKNDVRPVDIYDQK